MRLFYWCTRWCALIMLGCVKVNRRAERMLWMKIQIKVNVIIGKFKCLCYCIFAQGVAGGVDQHNSSGSGRPRFIAVTTLEDVQAVRCACLLYTSLLARFWWIL